MASVVLPGLAEQLDANNLISSNIDATTLCWPSGFRLAMRDALTSLRRDVIHSVVSVSSGTYVQVSDSLASPLRSHSWLSLTHATLEVVAHLQDLLSLSFLPHTPVLCSIC